MSRRENSTPRVRQTGLTLIELLVSLVILGFVVTVMSGAFFQVAQVVRVAEEANGKFQPQWLRLRAMSDLVANLVVPPDVARPFSGDASGFNGFSLLLPQGDWGVMRAFSVKLTRQDNGGMKLSLTPSEEKEIVLTTWDKPVQIEYLAADGSVQSMWPPFGKNLDLLPTGIQVRNVDGEQLVQLVAPYAGSRLPPPDPLKELSNLFGTEIK